MSIIIYFFLGIDKNEKICTGWANYDVFIGKLVDYKRYKKNERHVLDVFS